MHLEILCCITIVIHVRDPTSHAVKCRFPCIVCIVLSNVICDVIVQPSSSCMFRNLMDTTIAGNGPETTDVLQIALLSFTLLRCLIGTYFHKSSFIFFVYVC